MNILIIEDELPTAKHITRLIKKISADALVLGPIQSVRKAVEWFSSNTEPDLILCDIQLSDGMSFEIFEKVKVKAPIIFITAYDQYAIRAFKLNSIDYLLKPVDQDELKQAMIKLKDQRGYALSSELIKRLLQDSNPGYKSRFMVKLGDRIKSIKTDEILYFFSEEKSTYLHINEDKNYIIDYSLNDLEEMLDPHQFFRLNRQYIASIHSIGDVFIYSNSRLKVTLDQCEDDSILISRNNTEAFKQWMDDRLSNHQ